ncbi:hypothetical protein DFH07DRAFT_777768 [Mycena maculata]|uniref:Uncharacterized protein n=1 Tax=Mycena maculata TaxID=230809 RepID=A0AAD7IHA4_9AGAR|nr:hypothetical protein DFH07DRAFT_777768 [Mycena maculata]
MQMTRLGTSLTVNAHCRRTARLRNTSPTPSQLQTTSLVDDNYLDDNKYSPLADDHPFFDPNPAPPAPSASSLPVSAPSPADSAPSPSMSTSSPPLPSPSSAARSLPSPTVLDLPPSPTLTALPHSDDIEMDDPKPPATFTAPTRVQWLAAKATCKDKNPHRQRTVDDKQATTQHSDFQAVHTGWTVPILPNHVVLDNVEEPIQEAVHDTPKNLLAVIPFCNGVVLTDKYKNLRADILTVIELVAGKGKVKGKVTLIQPQAKVTTQETWRGAGKPNKFTPPIALIARCSDAEARTKLTDQATFSRDHGLAFHVTVFDATRHLRPTGSHRMTPDLCRLPRTPEPGQGQRRAQAPRPPRPWHAGHQLRPPELPHTLDPKLWDDIRAAARKITFTDDLEAFIPHANALSGHNTCANCKLDCHPKYSCTFTVRNTAWWGPVNLTHMIRFIKGTGTSDDDSEGDHLGVPRTRTGQGRTDHAQVDATVDASSRYKQKWIDLLQHQRYIPKNT